MHSPNLARLLLTVLLLSLSACATSPDPCTAQAPRQAVELPPLPAQVMDSPVPDYPAWLERVLSSSMARLFPTLPTLPSPQPTPAAP